MNIVSTQYTLKNKSFEIYLAGCKNHDCVGCHNSELWDFDIGVDFIELLPKIKHKINNFSKIIDKVLILGGEPLDNSIIDVLQLLLFFQQFNKKIWMFTHYEISEVPKEIFPYCDYIKTGSYIEALKTDNNIQYGIKLATNNQKVYKVR